MEKLDVGAESLCMFRKEREHVDRIKHIVACYYLLILNIEIYSSVKKQHLFVITTCTIS